MIVLRIGDIEVPCDSIEVAATLASDLRIVFECDTEGGADEMRRRSGGLWIGPVVPPKVRRTLAA